MALVNHQRFVIHLQCNKWNQPLEVGTHRTPEGDVPKDSVMSPAGTAVQVAEYSGWGDWTWG